MKKVSVHTIGGMVLDKDPRSVQPNELTYAKDNEIFGVTEGKDSSSYPYPSSVLSYTIPPLEQQNQYVRARFVNTATSYVLSLKDDRYGTYIGPSEITITLASLPSPTVANFVSALNTILNVYNYSADFDSISGDYFSLTILDGTTITSPLSFSITQKEINGSSEFYYDIFTIQDAFNPLTALDAEFKPLQTIQVNDVSFVFSKSYNGEGVAIGVATNTYLQDWSYTHLVVSNKLSFPEGEVIEIQGEEINNNQYALYWADNSGKPKVIYIPTNLTSPLKYTINNMVGTEGLFTLESIVEQTNLQIQNYGRIAFNNQLQSGGQLEAGTWFYFIASGIDRNYSEWSAASEPIPVFSSTTKSASAGAIIGGDKTPKVTSKANVLEVLGVDSKVYNSVKVAAMVNQGGAYSAFEIGEYDVANLQNPFYITHTGKETGIIDLDTASLPAVQEVFINSKNVQIKKNRLNLANVEIQVEEDLDEVFANVVLGQTTTTIEGTGAVDFSSEPLFRVAASPYNITVDGQASVVFTNDSTNGNFNTSSVFNLSTGKFTVPSGGTGTYYLNLSFSFNLPFPADLYPQEVYVLNNTNGEKYCLTTYADSLSVRNVLNKIDSVTLTAGDELVVAIFTSGLSSTQYRIQTFAFSATRAISNFPSKGIRVGEYQLPQNVATKTGYMINERYSFYARIKYTSGYLSQWRYLGQYQFGNGNFPSEPSDSFLTDSTSVATSNTNVYALTIDGIDVSSIKDRIEYIEFGRAICNPTILGTGVFIPSDSSTGGQGGTFNSGLYTGNTDATVYRSANSLTSDNRLFGVMLCPDWATGTIKPEFQDGDQLIVYGVFSGTKSQIISGGGSKFGSFWEFSGVFLGSGQPYIIDIEDAAYCEWNTNSRVLRNDANNLYKASSLSNNATITTLAAESMAVSLSSKIVPLTGTLPALDNGIYYVQYYRPNSNQYNEIDDTVVSCNTFIEVNSTSGDILPQKIVYGGDTYTQKTFMKVLYNAKNPATSPSYYVNSALTSFLGFYSQNKINQQMRYNDTTFTNQPYPFGNSLDNYLFGVYDAGEQFNIDNGYSWQSVIGNSKPYNPKILKQGIFKARIYYSGQKPINSILDSYRGLLPNDFKDLDSKNGEINGLYDINSVMVALQPFKVSVLPYQSDVGLSAEDGSLYVGNGGVYAQRENPVSSYGATLKSGTLVAENEAGNSVLYWFSENGRGLFRYSNDGVKNLSEENHLRSWFYNNTNLIKEEYDIVFGFDRTRSLIFMSTKGINRSVSIWNSGSSYSAGNYVRYGEIGKYQTFENLQDIYVATGSNTNENPYDNPDVWSYVQTAETEYYNYNSLVFNEKANFFQGFFTLIVSRYFNFNGRIYVPRGRESFNEVYELFGSKTGYLRWLDDNTTYKQGEWVVEWASNDNGLLPKRYSWVGLQAGSLHNTANNPTLLVYNDNQTSLSSGGLEFDYVAGQLGTGILPDINDDPISSSSYTKIRLSNSVFNRIYGVVAHFYIMTRNILK